MPQDHFRVTRVLIVAVPLLLLAAIIIQFTGVYKAAPSSDLTLFQHQLENQPSHVPGVPSALVVGLFVPVLLLCAAVGPLRRRWQVTRGELIVVFCMLVIAVPVMGPAFWHQFPGLQLEYVRVRQADVHMRRLSQAMAISPNLWPNRGNLLQGASVEDVAGPEGEREAKGPAPRGVRWTIHPEAVASVIDGPNGVGRCAQIVHRAAQDRSRITLALNRDDSARFVTGGLRYSIAAQLRLDDPGAGAEVSLHAGINPDRLTTIASRGSATRPALLAPDRFVTTGRIDYPVPRELDRHFFVELRFSGTGTLSVRDFVIVDTEDAFRYFEGYEEADPTTHAQLSEADRAAVRRRPDPQSVSNHWAYLLLGRVPWHSWARPLAVWTLFIVAMFLAMYCLVTIFYRQWEHGDRLTFPLQEFVQDLTRGDQRGRLLILRSKPFMIGFGACALHLTLRQLSVHIDGIPAANTSLFIPDLLPQGLLREGLTRAGNAMLFDIRPAFVAVAFLMSLEMSFSLLVFFAIWIAYLVGGSMTPLRTTPGFPNQDNLMIGGLLFMAGFFVFAARHHLVRVARSLVGRSGEPDGKAVDYRGATAGLMISVVLMLCFAHFAQVSGAFILLYLLVVLLVALFAARIRAETGLPHLMILPVYPQALLYAMGGAMTLGFREMVLPAQASFVHLGAFLMLAPIMAESMAAATRAGVPLRHLRTCLWAAFIVAVVVSGILVLSWAYTVGSANMHTAVTKTWHQHQNTMHGLDAHDQQITAHFIDHPDQEPILTPAKRREIASRPPGTWWAVAISFAMAGLLTLARTIWLGFPLHPLGYVLALTPAIGALWPSVLVAYGVKRLGLRFGGITFGRQVLRPFFVGLFVGDLFTLSAWRVLEGVV